MTQPAYPAAQRAAASVYSHFASHLDGASPQDDLARQLLPDVETISTIIDTAFWASLQREETYTPRISLAFVASEHVERPLRFERPVQLAAHPLTRLAPAVERPGIHLGVWNSDGELAVWGATRDLPASCFVLEVVAPGLLVIKHSRGQVPGKFVNVAVLQGEQIKIIDQREAAVPDCPPLLMSLLGLQTPFDSSGSVNVLIQLAVSMRTHGRGGSLLVVPTGSDSWTESMLRPITYSVVPPFSGLADLMQEPDAERRRLRWQESLRSAVDGVAGLTAVDGALVLTNEHVLLAFGAKIVRRRGFEQLGRVIATEPIEGTAATVVEPAELGGTRHLSAAQFAHDQRDAIALVASQDGRFTVFGWSPCEKMVHAHRIESLLL